jgi:ankyrin repeat protein
MTALHWAVKQGLPDVVELLVEKNANTEAMDNNGKTPLDLAREQVDGDQRIVDCLTKARKNG